MCWRSLTAVPCSSTSPGLAVASNPTPNQTLGSLSLGLHFLNEIPILYTVLAFILIIGVIYYGLFETRKNIQVHIPAETGAVEIPPESLPPDELA